MHRFSPMQRIHVEANGKTRTVERRADLACVSLRGDRVVVEWFPLRGEVEIAPRSDDVLDPTRFTVALGDLLTLLGIGPAEYEGAIIARFSAMRPAWTLDGELRFARGGYAVWFADGVWRAGRGWNVLSWYATLDEAADAVDDWVEKGGPPCTASSGGKGD